MGLLTTTVGSFPKPAGLVAARRALAEGEIEEPELLEIERRALREALALQAELGLDVFVTGGMDHDDPASLFAGRIEGMEIAGIVRAYGNTFVSKPRIVDALRRRKPVVLAGWKLASEGAPKPVKAVLPGPYSLMDACFDEHYASREECAMALAEVLRQEASDLAAAGASDLQIDETALGVRPGEVGLALRWDPLESTCRHASLSIL